MDKVQALKIAEILIACSELPIIVQGVNGPTGKTYLCNKLNELGFNAYEEWNSPKKSNDNFAAITITLNRRLKNSS